MKARQLTHPIHFYTAQMENALVLVFQDRELIGTGRIEAFEPAVTHDDLTYGIVTVRGETYVREHCTFEIAEAIPL
ncbi:hypothetical protein [Paenibacillus humicus]|uniref:hypothetical protein n=1 Tax=Paenibacillus humicus TaxID=412861 RepID=UPI000FD6F2D9|nr:hypothetical protein [Paenibacillus humicus]